MTYNERRFKNIKHLSLTTESGKIVWRTIILITSVYKLVCDKCFRESTIHEKEDFG